MATSLLYSDVTEEMVLRLNRSNDASSCKAALREALCGSSESAEATVKVEFYFFLYAFAKNIKLHSRETSTLLSVFKATIEHDQAEPLSTMQTSFQFLKDRLLLHCTERPPWTQHVFTPQQYKAIIDYALTSYYRHFRAYKRVLTEKVTIDLRQALPGAIFAPSMPVALAEMTLDEPEESEEESKEAEESAEGAEEAGAGADADSAAQAADGEGEEHQGEAGLSEEDAAILEQAVSSVVGKRRRELEQKQALSDLVSCIENQSK